MTNLAMIVADRLRQAGYAVTAADIPGLWDVAGIANDLTTGQLIDVAQRHVGLLPPVITTAPSA